MLRFTHSSFLRFLPTPIASFLGGSASLTGTDFTEYLMRTLLDPQICISRVHLLSFEIRIVRSVHVVNMDGQQSYG